MVIDQLEPSRQGRDCPAKLGSVGRKGRRCPLPLLCAVPVSAEPQFARKELPRPALEIVCDELQIRGHSGGSCP